MGRAPVCLLVVCLLSPPDTSEDQGGTLTGSILLPPLGGQNSRHSGALCTAAA